MDPKHTGEILKHLEKQDELLMDAYRSMSHELHKLQVEEEMLMRKFYEIMSARGLTKKLQNITGFKNFPTPQIASKDGHGSSKGEMR